MIVVRCTVIGHLLVLIAQWVKLWQITQRSKVQFPARMWEKNRTVKYLLLYSGELHVKSNVYLLVTQRVICIDMTVTWL